ncbi:hypothetical protein [Streptomyces halstedii]|uniref:Uncharacterized protein n=1 Tax=Streptomyces halstedii TaxID=1944 RepID=A0A6N9U7P6_STRHA|nr:hypothetical protein [Streptomyces halstedii]NEA19861.1 hypothetical protein [Streptomyces halstedii]
MGIADQFRDKARELADQAERRKRQGDGDRDAPRERADRGGERSAEPGERGDVAEGARERFGR